MFTQQPALVLVFLELWHNYFKTKSERQTKVNPFSCCLFVCYLLRCSCVSNTNNEQVHWHVNMEHV